MSLPLLALLLLPACFRANRDLPQETALDSSVDSPVDSPAPTEFVEVDGLVFRFIDRALMEGATVRLEGVGIETTSDADGNWHATVPAGRPFTPVVELEGHLTARHATFTLEEDLDRLYLQAVPSEVFGLMAQGLAEGGLEIDPERCVVVNTITVPEIDAMTTWEQFFDLRPHGEPDVTMELIPKTHGSFPIYFNEQIQPDPSLQASSRDGGVVWLNVAPGHYVMQGTHPEPDSFEVISREIDCEPGWFINLNPVRGAGVRAL